MHDGQDAQLRSSSVAASSGISVTFTPGLEGGVADDGSSSLESARGYSTSNLRTMPKPHSQKDCVCGTFQLERSVYMVYLTLLYGAAAMYSWAIICILTHRPIGGKSYGEVQLDGINNNFDSYLTSASLDELFAKSERYLRAARIVQSLVSVLAIPLTSAVCSQAAVVYIQRKRIGKRLTLRQSMALADRG